VESPHGHLKRRIAQALLLRESFDFASLADYRQWLDALVLRFNRRCAEALAIERAQLQALGAYLREQLAAGTIPSLPALEQRFEGRGEAPTRADLAAVHSTQHPLSSYDRLLGAHGPSLEQH
jgi:hypothetical protein